MIWRMSYMHDVATSLVPSGCPRRPRPPRGASPARRSAGAAAAAARRPPGCFRKSPWGCGPKPATVAPASTCLMTPRPGRRSRAPAPMTDVVARRRPGRRAPPRRRCVALPAMPTCETRITCSPIVHVVADLHEVVDLRAAADPRRAGGGAVDGRAGADLDVVADLDGADLRDLAVRARRRRRSRSRRCR